VTRPLRPRSVGVDFSAARDAGRRIWIATLEIDRDGSTLIDLRRGLDLPGGALEREDAIVALRSFLAEQTDAVVGIDVPFSLPAPLIDEEDWPAFLRAYAGRFADAEAFRAAMLDRAGGRELKRRTDRDARTPFSAYNLRLYRQTHHALRALLAPLIIEGRATGAPMQEARDGLPILIEACPASTLKRLDLYEAYKGRGEEKASVRERILASLSAAGRLRASSSDERVIVEDAGGDALDAVVAALASARVAREPERLRVADGDPARLEALVYF